MRTYKWAGAAASKTSASERCRPRCNQLRGLAAHESLACANSSSPRASRRPGFGRAHAAHSPRTRFTRSALGMRARRVGRDRPLPHLGRPTAQTAARCGSRLPFDRKRAGGCVQGCVTVCGSSCKRPHRRGSRLSALLTGREGSTPQRWQRGPCRCGGVGAAQPVCGLAMHALGLLWVRVLSGAPGDRL